MICALLPGILTLLGDPNPEAFTPPVDGQSKAAPVPGEAGPTPPATPVPAPTHRDDYLQREGASQDREDFRGGGIGLLIVVVAGVVVAAVLAVLLIL